MNMISEDRTSQVYSLPYQGFSYQAICTKLSDDHHEPHLYTVELCVPYMGSNQTSWGLAELPASHNQPLAT